MKKLILTLSLLLGTSSFAFANEDVMIEVRTAFLTSELVKASGAELVAEDKTLKPADINFVAVEGGCGVAGCDNTWLVVQEYRHHGTNTYYKSVSALVQQSAVGKSKVLKVVKFD